MQKTHEPANAEQCRHKTAETIESVLQSFAVRALGDQTEHNAREQRKQYGEFEVVESDLHVTR